MITFKRRLSLLLILPLALLPSASCQSETKLSVNDKVPPTFLVEGSGHELFFSVYEVVFERDKNGNTSGLTWTFKSKQRSAHETWLPITYGELPEEFEQTFPKVGPPAPLMENKLYGAHATIHSTAGDEVWFYIKGGKTIQVSKHD